MDPLPPLNFMSPFLPQFSSPTLYVLQTFPYGFTKQLSKPTPTPPFSLLFTLWILVTILNSWPFLFYKWIEQVTSQDSWILSRTLSFMSYVYTVYILRTRLYKPFYLNSEWLYLLRHHPRPTSTLSPEVKTYIIHHYN